MVKFLLVTDIHYSDRDIPGAERRNCLSPQKLKNVIKEHSEGCDFIIDLGDTADDLEGYGDQRVFMNEIADIFKSSGLPYYCAIGNHDTSLPKYEITEILGMPHRYYSFETDDFTFIILDGNMNDKYKPYPEKEIIWQRTHLDPDQLLWLEKTVEESEKPIIVFCHELFLKEFYENDDDLVLRNRDEAVSIFEKSGKVIAAISGHDHFGDYVYHNGIHYITLQSLCLHEDETCSVITIDDKNITVDGYGFQKSLKVDI